MLRRRAHRVPDERDADLGVLWAGLGLAALEGLRNLPPRPCPKEAIGLGRRTPTGIASRISHPRSKRYPDPSKNGTGERQDDMQQQGTVERDKQEGMLKLLLGRICCVMGLLSGVGGFVVATLGASVNLSAGAVGIALGVLGYFLGARRLGAASVVLGTAAIFFMAAASTGLIPGIEPLGHGYD